MVRDDIRWIQRFNNFKKALAQLTDAVELMNERELSRLEKQGLIQVFEFTHELAWKTLKDFLADRGTTELFGSKDVTREAFKVELIPDGQVWMDMIKSRNLTSHTYDEATTDEIVEAVKGIYYQELNDLSNRLQRFMDRECSE